MLTLVSLRRTFVFVILEVAEDMEVTEVNLEVLGSLLDPLGRYCTAFSVTFLKN